MWLGPLPIIIIMTSELEELLHSTFILRQTLSKVLQPEAVNYIMELIAKDGAHRKLMKLLEENNNGPVAQ